MGKTNDATGVFARIEMRGGVLAHGRDGRPSSRRLVRCCVQLRGGRPRDPRPYFQSNGRRTQAYRVVYELVHGVTLHKTQLVLHSCDRGGAPVGCCNPKHMSIGTERKNAAEMVQRERYGLPHMVVRNIRRLLAADRPQAEIAELYGVSRETVSAIATGRTYKVVGDEDGDTSDNGYAK